MPLRVRIRVNPWGQIGTWQTISAAGDRVLFFRIDCFVLFDPHQVMAVARRYCDGIEMAVKGTGYFVVFRMVLFEGGWDSVSVWHPTLDATDTRPLPSMQRTLGSLTFIALT